MKEAKMTLKILAAILFIAYPFAVLYLTNKGAEPRYLALVLLVLLAAQFFGKKGGLKYVFISIWAVLITCLIVFNNALFAKLYPILINLALLAVFSLSLKYPPSVAERFARMKEKDLPESAVNYCRTVTKIWCAFFIFNASASALTLLAPVKIWALYNGFISYIIMGLIFTAEYIARILFKRKTKYD